jgi:hypothetical protein
MIVRTVGATSWAGRRSTSSQIRKMYVAFTRKNTAASKETGSGANSLTAIQAVESGSSETENRCAKLNHIRRGVAVVA